MEGERRANLKLALTSDLTQAETSPELHRNYKVKAGAWVSEMRQIVDRITVGKYRNTPYTNHDVPKETLLEAIHRDQTCILISSHCECSNPSHSEGLFSGSPDSS